MVYIAILLDIIYINDYNTKAGQIVSGLMNAQEN